MVAFREQNFALLHFIYFFLLGGTRINEWMVLDSISA